MAVVGMSAAGRAARRPVSTGRTLHAPLRLILSADAEARHLHGVEREGEAAETPFIAMLGLVLFFLTIFVFMTGLAFAAYYLA